MNTSGEIYVADEDNNRILKFPPGSTSATNGVVVAGGNGGGNANNQLSQPTHVFVDKRGNIYVADIYNYRIQKFPNGSTSLTNGITIAGGNGSGSNANQFVSGYSVFVDDSGFVYVADQFNYRIQKFPPGSDSATNGITVAGGNGLGHESNQIFPRDVWVDSAGYIYVVDAANNRIQKFPPNSISSTSGYTIAKGSGGTNDIVGMCIDKEGYIYTVSYSQVQKFPPTSDSLAVGVVVAGGATAGSADNQLHDATSVYVDGDKNIYVTDNRNNRVQKWSQSITAVAAVEENLTLNIYPNPNNGSFILESSKSIGQELAIYDMIGKEVIHQTITSDKQMVELRGLSAGAYSLEIKGSSDRAIRFTFNP